MHTIIEKSAFRRGEYIAHANGAQRVRKGGLGWETYGLASAAGQFTPATAPTLTELGDKLSAQPVTLKISAL